MKLIDKEIILGVTGSIAAYKSAELVRILTDRGANVSVVMTKAAMKFIAPLTLETLSKNPVITDLFEERDISHLRHISLTEKADLILIAPATANIIGKISAGIADDMLSTLVIAAKCPILIAPAMNERMWQNSIVQGNIAKLIANGIRFIEPGYGKLACEKIGNGRLADIERICSDVEKTLIQKSSTQLLNKKVLITTGPTQEPIDVVRYITNASSGKMGFALAEVAHELGAQVTLITGPTNLRLPEGIFLSIPIHTASEMRSAVVSHFPTCDIFIASAAVSDYRPAIVYPDKLKKQDIPTLTLTLVKNPDILAEVSKDKGHRILIGFAAESDDLITNAKKKLEEKSLDMIVANDITQQEVGFGSDMNKVLLIPGDGQIIDLPVLPKKEVARKIFEWIGERIKE